MKLSPIGDFRAPFGFAILSLKNSLERDVPVQSIQPQKHFSCTSINFPDAANTSPTGVSATDAGPTT
jgi:hypothetical protein